MSLKWNHAVLLSAETLQGFAFCRKTNTIGFHASVVDNAKVRKKNKKNTSVVWN